MIRNGRSPPCTAPNHLADGIIHLGNKGLNLVKLNQMGLPVPPGFIVTTEVFRCRDIINTFRPAQENFKEQVIHNIKKVEKITGKAFGDASNPLLLSVRSGSSISQPGMMDTFLNVGMNEVPLPTAWPSAPATNGLPGITTAGSCNAMAWGWGWNGMILTLLSTGSNKNKGFRSNVTFPAALCGNWP